MRAGKKRKGNLERTNGEMHEIDQRGGSEGRALGKYTMKAGNEREKRGSVDAYNCTVVIGESNGHHVAKMLAGSAKKSLLGILQLSERDENEANSDVGGPVFAAPGARPRLLLGLSATMMCAASAVAGQAKEGSGSKS